MRTSGADGFGAVAPARIAVEHLPKVIRRQVYYGSESSCQESDLPPDPKLDSRLPQHEFNSEFCATKKYQKLSCVHGHTLARRVCTEGFDIGRRFLSCPLEGCEACAFVNWLDEEWHGRARSVITKLTEDNVKLKKKLADLECTISTMKQERINHMQHMKARDKKELACVVVVVALAMFYVLFAMMIRFFLTVLLKHI
ncbi:hypothetical protein VPH35_138548 [Triticum aestivum]